MASLPRVVVTGVGLVTPLGVGVASTWRRILDGQCGVVSLANDEEFQRLPCRIAARVPKAGEGETKDGATRDGLFRESDHVTPSDRRTMSLSTLYALTASEEALKMAGVSRVREIVKYRVKNVVRKSEGGGESKGRGLSEGGVRSG